MNRKRQNCGIRLARMFAVLISVCCLISLNGTVAAEWYQFTADDVPEDAGYLVSDFTGSIRITFLGDCTLGGEEAYRNSPQGFVKTIEREGYSYPFENLTFLTANDDLTVANLEGVLSDKRLGKAEKTFNFSGLTEYTEILRRGGIECVSLANNHTYDYGAAGYEDTQAALADAGIAFFGTDQVAACKIHGVMIGFAGISITLNGAAGPRFQKQIAALKNMGCSVIITVMHAGREYRHTPNVYQRRMAGKAVSYGTDLVIGHHPHVVQGYETIEGIPVVYSLGNCVFGGNQKPDEYEAIVVQAELIFEDGQAEKIRLHFYPILTSGTDGLNDFRPVIPDREISEHILNVMKDSTGVGFTELTDADGAIEEFDIQ